MTAPGDPTYPLTPIISTTGYFNLGGVNNDVCFLAVNTFEISDRDFMDPWKQSIRAGFLGEKNQFNFDDPNNKRGSLNFLTFQDFLLGLNAAGTGSGFSNVNTSGSQQGSYYKGYRGTAMAMFIQDDLKLGSNLTINAGLRWELNSGVSTNKGVLHYFLALAGHSVSASSGRRFLSRDSSSREITREPFPTVFCVQAV